MTDGCRSRAPVRWQSLTKRLPQLDRKFTRQAAMQDFTQPWQRKQIASDHECLRKKKISPVR